MINYMVSDEEEREGQIPAMEIEETCMLLSKKTVKLFRDNMSPG